MKIYGLDLNTRLENVFDTFMQNNSKAEVQSFLITSLKRQNLRLFKDGNQWCCMVGENLQAGIAGFGKTRYDAWGEFIQNYLA